FASTLFAFEGEWGPAEPDPSVQVLARRRLRGPAALRFTGKPADAGSVRLALTVRGVPLAVVSECGPPPPKPLEPGYHWVGFDLPASGSCTIRFPAPVRSSGASDSLADAARVAQEEAARTSLDVAAWRPSPR
ncbi:MAG TPA: hypothetical protein VIZ69_08925, partial [Thermoanaerobaculia bacterium]